MQKFTHFDFTLGYNRKDKSWLKSYETKGQFLWVHFRGNFREVICFREYATDIILVLQILSVHTQTEPYTVDSAVYRTCLFASLCGGLAEGKSIADAVYRTDLHHIHRSNNKQIKQMSSLTIYLYCFQVNELNIFSPGRRKLFLPLSFKTQLSLLGTLLKKQRFW